MKTKNLHTYLFFALLISYSEQLLSQADSESTISMEYESKLIGRFYFSKKYTALQFKSLKHQNFRYLPSTTLNLGVGVTYKSATLNLAYGFGFLNPNREKRGNTKYLDLQTNMVLNKKYVIGFYGEFYRGFYSRINDDEPYYIRKDLNVNILGISVLKILNHKNFDLQSPISSHRKYHYSGGTVLLGGEITGGIVSADSAIIPGQLQEINQLSYQKVSFFKLAPSIGFGFKLIILKRLIFNGAISTGLAVGYTNLTLVTDKQQDFLYFRPDFNLRLYSGVLMGEWNLGILFNNERTRFLTSKDNEYANIDIGNLRLILSRRINLK
ncbi:DUF4421 family protein [Mangrovivirga sp. M17]|uniref:DUF4421 family protein n=1 Tax=Mangrovivirga halotolerans TaxID=2993936 RepID=A0ABT3RRN1_9BACT|nr:DUF4421 family protein [Mangrovivirga halotolerans]MCX2743932.1 DUF4421 family protein [Mangrovivirga halotolerans]